MSIKRKWLGITLTLALAVSTAGCSTAKTENSEGSGTSTEVKGPAKISMFASDAGQPVPGGESMDDPTVKYLAEKTNTDLNITFIPNSQYRNQLSVKFASGEIPDIVQGWGINAELADNDQLLPLNDLIEEHGPNLKKVISQDAWDAVTRDGKILAIPEAPLGDSPVARVLFVRKDWMDKVGIKEAPKTDAEFLDMLRAFRDKDPNGNGIQDEIPFSARENFTWLDNVLSMYGVNLYGGTIENNEVIPQYVSKNMKPALGIVKKMMEEKLIDSEFMSNKRNVWEQKIQSDLVGAWVHAPNLAWDWQERLNKSLPNGNPEVIAIPTPKAPGVKESGFNKSPHNKAFSITKSSKDPAAAVRLFDWLVTEEGQEFVQFGVPGITVTKDNGKIDYNKQKDTDDKTALWRPLVFNMVGFNEEIQLVLSGDEQAVAKIKEVYEIGKKEGTTNVTAGAPSFKSDQPEIGDYVIPSTMFIETAGRIVLGEKPLDYFDEFVNNWRARGGDELIKEATEWYQQNGKQ
ncbi:extracellular solute-binding protein family 1 [Paenibacillus algicola]|uniref:Extracellular solute-binding protein family 1 n=1 Tax=Paenibacillus algicola TaxID=2565926 RepID=A0A4P8XNA6_9BACL|nr:extracellular solute-binding protein [Paenibacillus algicola]QCT04048.1 extracellular solute-binding protein family 1 [Paenibacillus algicola]